MAIMQGAQLFRDTNGEVAQLHGIGVQRFGDRWYAYGEIKTTATCSRAWPAIQPRIS